MNVPTTPVSTTGFPSYDSAPANPHVASMSSRPPTAQGHMSRYSDDDSKTAVKVAVRVRPPLDASDPSLDLIPHRFRGSTCQVTNPSSLTVQSAQGKKLFVFDRVFSDQEDQQAIWDYISDSVNSFVQGYNVSILAYGQSGAGKSYTMGTANPGEHQEPQTVGIVPRAAAALFDKLSPSSPNGTRPLSSSSGLRPPKRYNNPSENGENKTWQLKATYVEIYNEQLRDLLVPDSVPVHERSTVSIREDTKGRILMQGLQQVPINSVDDLINALNFGSSIRQTDSTGINSKSSRSHAVFSLNLVHKKNKAVNGNGAQQFSASSDNMNGAEHWVTIDSKLHFVDLAGSERLKNSGLTGERVKEGISINAGLASLGKVIAQLSSRSAGSHVSYRDSRLTRLLQDSLGGNAITYMIACVNPVEFHLSETLNTVQYAQRARAIQSKPQIQQRAEDGDKQLVIDRLRSEVAFLRDQIRMSERSERRSNPELAREGRKNDRENELQNQLLDIQENYSALSQRHAKLIAEIAQSKGDDDGTDALPVLKGVLGSSSLERLDRSSTFAEAVEHVVLEYEKTIQSLESSLSTARSTLSTSESSLLEREAKLVYMEAVTGQLQARVQKSMEREANSDDYLKDLEKKLDQASTGEEKHMVVIQELRKELLRVRESESSAEEYISTLEERLAEAEQDTDIMQREIRRLEHVVERQRTVGKMDNLLHELDNIKHEEMRANEAARPKMPETTTDMFHDRLVATTSASHPNGEMGAEEAEEHWKSFGPMEGVEETASVVSITETKGKATMVPAADKERIHSQAQSRAIADKLETVTIELFELRVDNENTAAELEDVSRKYQIALSTLAELQDALDEARTRPSAHSATDGAELADGQRASSQMLSSDVSSRGGSPTLVESSDAGAPSRKDESLADAVRRLKRANAEKDINMAELHENYAQLESQHESTIKYVEELKEELAKVPQQQQQQQQEKAANHNLLRRSASPPTISNERETRVFASLRNLAVENFQGKPQAAQTFETNLSAAATESKLRSERIQALEAELVSVRSEMDVKNTMIAGLTRERSVRPTATVDMSLVSTMRDHVTESQKQIAALLKSGAEREGSLLGEVRLLKASLAKHATGSEGDVTAEASAKSAGTSDKAIGQDEQSTARDQQVASLHKEMASWEEKHQASMETSRASEQQLLATISGLETSLRNAENLHAEQSAASAMRSSMHSSQQVDYEAEKAKHLEQVATLQREIDGYKATADTHASKLLHLENSYAMIIKEVEEDAKSRQLTESELATHRNLVMNLEQQIEQQKSLAAFHQSGLKSLEESHTKELEDLKSTLSAQQAQSEEKHRKLLSDHEESKASLKREVTKAQKELSKLQSSVALALNQEVDPALLDTHLKSLSEERRKQSSGVGVDPEALSRAQKEAQTAKATNAKLEQQIKELSKLGEDTLKKLEASTDKEKKSAQIVQELEEQLNASFDQHKTTQNRLSSVQKDGERELESHKARIGQLENQLADVKRESTASVSRSASNASNLRKSNSHQTLPVSPPPATPLPPLPGNLDASGAQRSPKPDTSPPTTAGADLATVKQLEEQDMRIKTIEKHLYAEKQLTQTLEEALVDLETQANKTKKEVEAWKKKCREVEEEASGLRRERGTIRNSLQAVEEERDRRIRAEMARKQLEERMEQLGKKKKKQAGLNCF